MPRDGTRNDASMRAAAAKMTLATLRACLAEAERENDLELAVVLREEVRRRAS